MYNARSCSKYTFNSITASQDNLISPAFHLSMNGASRLFLIECKLKSICRCSNSFRLLLRSQDKVSHALSGVCGAAQDMERHLNALSIFLISRLTFFHILNKAQ